MKNNRAKEVEPKPVLISIPISTFISRGLVLRKKWGKKLFKSRLKILSDFNRQNLTTISCDEMIDAKGRKSPRDK